MDRGKEKEERWSAVSPGVSFPPSFARKFFIQRGRRLGAKKGLPRFFPFVFDVFHISNLVMSIPLFLLSFSLPGLDKCFYFISVSESDCRTWCSSIPSSWWGSSPSKSVCPSSSIYRTISPWLNNEIPMRPLKMGKRSERHPLNPYGSFYFTLFATQWLKKTEEKREKKENWRGHLTETIGAYERLGLLEHSFSRNNIRT